MARLWCVGYRNLGVALELMNTSSGWHAGRQADVVAVRIDCRRCWGLTYGSRTLQNDKPTPWGRGMFRGLFGTTQRDWGSHGDGRETPRARSGIGERWEARRQLLQGR